MRLKGKQPKYLFYQMATFNIHHEAAETFSAWRGDSTYVTIKQQKLTILWTKAKLHCC